MSELKKIQARFAADLLHTDRPRGAMGVYHDNLRANFRRSLAIAYPALQRLVGDAYFDQLALEWRARTPSRSGDLHPIGAGFSEFLRAHFAGSAFTASRYAFLAEVAALEWAWQESFLAADAPTLEPSALNAWPAEQWPQLQLGLHPAFRFVASRYPVHALWCANRTDSAPDAVIDLDRGGECVVLSRPHHEVLVRCVTAGELEFLQALQTGAGLAGATDRALACDAEFDLVGALSQTFASGLITQCAATTTRLGSAGEKT